jgi:hypothetical protein
VSTDRLHGVISQKMVLFITTALKNSNLSKRNFCFSAGCSYKMQGSNPVKSAICNLLHEAKFPKK